MEERRNCDAVILQKLTDLTHRLYGEEHDKGDIPTIVRHLEKINGSQVKMKVSIAVLFVLVLGGTGAMKIAGLL